MNDDDETGRRFKKNQAKFELGMDTLEQMLQSRLDTLELCDFVCTCVVGLAHHPTSREVAVSNLLLAARDNGHVFAKLLTVLDLNFRLLIECFLCYREMVAASQELSAPSKAILSPDTQLQLFGTKLAELFQNQHSISLYLTIHAAPLAEINHLRQQLMRRQWNFGAIEDRSEDDGLGFLGKFAEAMWALSLGLNLPSKTPRLSVI
jgi:hypothetical protein